MSRLPEGALHTLCYNALSFADNLFQMWLTVTFAAILAIYFSHSHITPYLRRLLIGLYLGASIMLISPTLYPGHPPGHMLVGDSMSR
jgi:hypothetical protein